ncbi:MAG: hypothetical protein NTX92_05510 [Euryarchaeota archaeon]|jgi:hypothetical protein|nr:hypothetical protein [Euryarchaeota archaeon]
MNIIPTVQTLTHVLLAIVSILFIITGFGISNYQTIESLTGGTLSKLTSFQIHSNLIIPFIVLLIAHIGFTIGKKILKKKQP